MAGDLQKIVVLCVVALAVVAGGVYLLLRPTHTTVTPNTYSSQKYELSFSYPSDYFVAFEKSMDGEREQHAVVLAEDTPDNRALLSNPQSATEGPPTITIAIFQNNLDHYTLQSFVEGTSFSNFKLSDGSKEEVTLGGEQAWRYQATGLYENDNVVVVRPDYVYMFTVFYNAPTDQIRTDFNALLKTVAFVGGGTPAPGGGDGVMCTADAMQCPDGSWVGRTGPNCEFVCPGGTGGGQGIRLYESGVRGTVTMGPTCPVVQNPPQSGCEDKPYAAAQVAIYRTSGLEVPFILTRTDAQGAFEASLPPGEYTVIVGESTLPSCSTQDVTVGPDAYTPMTISCDTGIR